MDESQEERRKVVRIKKFLIARYSCCPDAQKRIWDETQVRDLSEQGMLITTSRSFESGDTLFFLLRIPLSPLGLMVFQGKVVGSEELKSRLERQIAGTYLTRIEFMDLKEEQKELMRKYVAWFLTKKGDKL